MTEFFESWVVAASRLLGIEDLQYAGVGPIIALISVLLGAFAFYHLVKFAMKPFIPLFHGETLADYGRIHEPKPKRVRERVAFEPERDETPAHALAPQQVDPITPSGPPVIRILPLDDFVRGNGIDLQVARELATGLHSTLQRVPNLKTQKACLSSPASQPCQMNGSSAVYVVAGTVKEAADRARVKLCVKDAKSGERIWTRNEDVSPNEVARLAQEFAVEIGGAVIMRQGSAKDLLRQSSQRAVTRQSGSTYPSGRPQEIEPQRTFDQPAA